MFTLQPFSFPLAIKANHRPTFISSVLPLKSHSDGNLPLVPKPHYCFLYVLTFCVRRNQSSCPREVAFTGQNKLWKCCVYGDHGTVAGVLAMTFSWDTGYFVPQLVEITTGLFIGLTILLNTMVTHALNIYV